MLPPMSPNGHDPNDLLKDDLTDGAIETLYTIIQRAQDASQPSYQVKSSSHRTQPSRVESPSSRALFNAYEQVLEEQGLQPSDDTILHRFLFRMQETKRRHEGIVQRFQRVLGDLGIEVEVNEDGEGVEVTSNIDRTRDAMRNGAVAALGRHSRRGSFDSFFDGTADKIAGTEYGDLPVRPRPGSASGVNGMGNSKSQRRATSDTEAHLYQQAHIPIRNRVNGHIRGRSFSGQHPARRRSVSVSSRGSLQIRRHGRTATSQTGDYDEDESDETDHSNSLDLSHVQVPGLNAPIPTAPYESPHDQPYYALEPFRPSDTRLLDDAETFEQQRLHRLARACLQTWRNRAADQRSNMARMERLADSFDRRILLKLSFEQLRDTTRLRRSNRETERFFGRLEERADKARNLFLLTKAFTHWAKSAEDEVQRTSVARRHILRTRFFNGWREITAVNELKVHNFVLARFLRQWRMRTAIKSEANEFAIAVYESNLVRRVYKEWFFKFCAVAAPAWRSDRMKKITLSKMNEIAKILHERNQWAAARYDRGLVRKAFQTWGQRTRAVSMFEPQADGFRQNALLSSAFRALRKQAQLQPLLLQFQQRSRGETIWRVFQEWQHASRLSRQARDIDRMRVLRNGWTAWNDRLRIKALEDRINDRILVESLYKWTLASRVSLFQRVHDRQLKESTFLSWVMKTSQRSNSLHSAERRFAQFKRAQLLRSCLKKMEAITADRRAEEYAVTIEYEQKLKRRIFDELKDRQAHFQQLAQWSNDAAFYVLSKRTLKIWTEATQVSRRNKRRDTYAQFRRKVKTNSVRRVFALWRERAGHIALLEQQANDMLEQRVVQTSGSILHDWHDRTITLRQLDIQAANSYAFKLETRHFRTWSERSEAFQHMNFQALALRQENTELAAASALKKFGWRLWNFQRQEENARALYERNFEKHVRAMIRFWAEQTNERLANRPVSPTPTNRSRRSHRDEEGGNAMAPMDTFGGEGDAADQDDNSRGLRDWTAFDQDAIVANEDLDLSFSVTPEQTKPARSIQPSSRQLPSRSIFRSTPSRPNTYPQPQSSMRPPPTIPEDSILDPAFAANLDYDMADPSTFWSGTPMAPLPSALNKSKPGYLKTPSKRSIARTKHPELPASPEKKEREVSPIRRDLGAMSAPPVQMRAPAPGLGRGLTSFQSRLRDGGFRASVAGTSGIPTRVRGQGWKGKGRVGFGDVSEMG